MSKRPISPMLATLGHPPARFANYGIKSSGWKTGRRCRPASNRPVPILTSRRQRHRAVVPAHHSGLGSRLRVV